MTKITIGTMVKNEDDIVALWIEYYGELFGYENLYIIDNYSDDLTYEIPEDAFEKYSNLKFSIELFIEMTHYIKATQFIRILLNDFVKGRILQDIQKHLRLANLSKYATYNDVKSFGKIPINGAPNFYRIADLSVMTIDYDKNLYEKKLMAKLFILCDDDFKRQVYK